ncbi:biotin holocarboxylase synthetase [Boothiomyces sp. JEL0866]|nr:biotin holocarboxylase synthetase [Boothiomyces sp. JEL0866]
MNVLIYDGPGVTSLQQPLIKVLKKLLCNSYDVIPVDPATFINAPFEDTTSLIVMPGGRDLLFLESLGNKGINKIRNYVRNGGKYLGICGGAYFACNKVEFEVGRPLYEVVGERSLQLCPAVAKGCVVKGFEYNTEKGSAAVEIKTLDDTLKVYVNGGPSFHLNDPANSTVLARYTLNNDPAIVETILGKGKSIVIGPHLEVSSDLLKEQMSSMLNDNQKKEDLEILTNLYPEILNYEAKRYKLFSSILQRLGMVLDGEFDPEKAVYPIWISVLNSDDHLYLQSQLLAAASKSQDGIPIIKDTISEWLITDSLIKVEEASKEQVLFYQDGPTSFDIRKFQNYLKTLSSYPTFGKVLLYSELTSSTQTLIEKNPIFANILPSGSVFVASQQSAGKGRGKNSWISQKGCLQFSMRLIHTNMASVVFIQYLMGLAVVQGIRKTKGCENLNVHLKWPNDIYAKTEDGLKKIGGILITSEFFQKSFALTIGCGLNVLNSKPSVCLQDLTSNKIEMEGVLASILSEFELLYTELVSFIGIDDVFAPFRDRYYKYWLHTNQLVNVEDVDGNITECVIRGLDENGFLKAKTNAGGIISLQPDGNSFDMLKGLIFVKK